MLAADRDNINCTYVWDCTAHDAAKAAVEAAQTAYDNSKQDYSNARQLEENIKSEMQTAASMLNDFKAVYNVLNSVGPSVANPNNMTGLSSSIKCISGYGSFMDHCKECSYNCLDCRFLYGWFYFFIPLRASTAASAI